MQTKNENTQPLKGGTANTNGNANSQRAGSAASQSTESTEPNASDGAGPLDRSVLAEALAEGFERQARPEEQEQNQSPERDRTAEAEEQATAETEENLTAPEVEAEAENANGEETPSPEDEAEAEEEEEEEEEQESPGIKKRIGKLQGKIEALERELAEAKSAEKRDDAAAGDGRTPKASGLDAITSPAELDRREEQSEQALEECETWLARLQTNPGRVEKYLRENGIKLQDNNGEEEYTPDRMADTLVNWRSQLRQTLKGIPKRREFLQEHGRFLQNLVKAKPWMGDRTDERYLAVQKVMANVPGLRGRADGEYWAACAVEGHMANLARNGKTNPKSQNPNPNKIPNTKLQTPSAKAQTRPNTGGGSAGPRTRTDAGKVAAAKARVLAEGSRGALAEFLDARG